MRLIELLYRIFVLKKPRLTPDETDFLMDEYIKLRPKSRDWTGDKWDQKIPKLPEKIARIKYGSSDPSRIQTLRELETAQRESNQEYLQNREMNQKRTEERLKLSMKKAGEKDCLRGPELYDPFAVERVDGINVVIDDMVVKCNTELADPLSSQIILPESRKEELLEFVARGQSPVIQITNVLNWRRVYGRIGDFSPTLSAHEMVVPIGMFLQLGGTTGEEILDVKASMCLIMPPIGKLSFKFIGESPEVLKKIYPNVVARIETRITYDRMPGLSRGMELFLWPRVSVVLDAIYSPSGEELFAGGFPVHGHENVLLIDIH